MTDLSAFTALPLTAPVRVRWVEYPFCERFGMTEHHGRRTVSSHTMPDSHNVEPIIGHHFSSCDRTANSIYENLCSSSRNASEPCYFEPL